MFKKELSPSVPPKRSLGSDAFFSVKVSADILEIKQEILDLIAHKLIHERSTEQHLWHI